MKILNFTNMIGTGVRKGVMLTFMILLGVVVQSYAQTNGEECTMVCSGELITPVDPETCESTVSYLNLLTNPCFEDGYKVEIRTLNNQLIAEGNETVTVSLVGKFIYKVIHEINGNDIACWGYIKFEDKKGPIKDLKGDVEPPTLVCGQMSADPSGVDDLATEIVSCVVKEEYGDAALEPWFDVLEKSDFKDCTGVKDVFNYTDKYDFCTDDLPEEIYVAATQSDIPYGWEPCYVYKRSWFASDKTGRLSDTCSQYLVVVRPSEGLIKIDAHTEAECDDDLEEVLSNGFPYFIDLSNAEDFLTCPKKANEIIRMQPGKHYCKYAVSVNYDDRVALCNTDGSKVFKQRAHWTVMDWCSGTPIHGNEVVCSIRNATDYKHCNLNIDLGVGIRISELNSELYSIETLKFTEYTDGTGELEGTIVNIEDMGIRFEVSAKFYGRTLTTTFPVREPRCNNDGDLSKSYFYTGFSGEFIGLDNAAGAIISFSKTGEDVHVGLGAAYTDSQPGYGLAGWFDAQIIAQPNIGGPWTLNAPEKGNEGDFQFRLDGANECINAGVCSEREILNYNHCNLGIDLGVGIRINELSSDLFEFTTGAFTEYENGTAVLNGSFVNVDDSSLEFDVRAVFSGRTKTTDTEIRDPNCFGEVDQSDWYFYTNFHGEFIGKNAAQGASIAFKKTGDDVHVGLGAAYSDAIVGNGLTAWFTAEILSQPDNNGPWTLMTPVGGNEGDFQFRLQGGNSCKVGNPTSIKGEDYFEDYTTVLKVEDTQAPVANGQSNFNAITALFDCTADVVVGPQSFDDCVGVQYYETTAEYVIDGDDPHLSRFERLTVPTNGITLNDVPLNVIVYVTYTATDSCGNIGTAYNEIFIEDDRAPVCIANDELNIGMVRLSEDPDDVGARIYGEDLDDTSRDNCAPLILEVRRADQAAASNDPDTLWAEYVEFSKADLTDGGCRGEYKVELRVTEDLGEVLDLIPTVNGGNDYYHPRKALSSTCWSTVILEDKNPPILKVDEVKIAKCTEPMPEFDELDITGCYDGVDSTIDTLYDNDCDYYEILRVKKTWRTFRNHDGVKQYIGSATQEIIIENVHDSKFTFPMDVKIDCSVAEIPTPTSIDEIIDEEGCSNWLMEVEDREFESNDPDACRKILRKYTFINWCTWDPSNTELAAVRRPQAGVWSEDQRVVLHYQDNDYDKLNDIDDADDGDLYDIEVSEYGHTSDGAWVQIDNGDQVQNETVYNHTGDIRGEDITSVDGYNYGYFSYIQVIKIQDNEKPVAADPVIKQFCDPLDTDCTFPTKVEITLGGSDNCSDLFYSTYLQLDQQGNYIHDTYGDLVENVLTGHYPVGTHNLLIKTADACGNAVQDTIELVVNPECKKPTPICRATFTAAMENGSVSVWASDIESGSSYDNCTDYADLTFGIEVLYDRNDDDIIDASDVSAFAPDATSATLTCEHIGTSIIALWATDEAGNEQYCLVPITVTDNQGVCANQEAKVSGAIVNAEDEEIDNVIVQISTSGVNVFSQIFNGVFDFFSIPMHRDVTVTAEKDQGYLNGVSTSDLVLLQRHILGVNQLNSPYKLIAADANRDDKVDTRDLLHLSRLILGVYDELPNNTSWRFVDKNYTFVNPTSPWGFPESATFNNLDSDVRADFIGMKIGDISGNARPSNLLGDDNWTPVGTVSFATDNVELVAGVETTVMLEADVMEEVSGYQFTIQLMQGTVFNGLTFGEESELTEANFGLTMVDQNMITVSWSKADAVNIKKGTELFGLKLMVPTNTNVQNVVSLNSAFTAAEAYDNDLNPLGVVLNINSSSNDFELYQNAPNPVSNETVIGFNLPDAGIAKLSIMDVSGRILKQVEGSFVKGYNQITLNRSELGSAGVLYYQLDTDQNSASKKMIIID